MKVIRYSLFILLVCLTVTGIGCREKKADEPVEIITAENFLKLRKGMTISEVKCILGEPSFPQDGTPLDGNRMLYTWSANNHIDGKLPYISIYFIDEVAIQLEQRYLGPKREQ